MGNKVSETIKKFNEGCFDVALIALQTGASQATVKVQLYKWKKEQTINAIINEPEPTPQKVEATPQKVEEVKQPTFETTITKNEFNAYERVRQSGKTNMFDIPKVIVYSGGRLNREKCLKIMKEYGQLKSIYM